MVGLVTWSSVPPADKNEDMGADAAQVFSALLALAALGGAAVTLVALVVSRTGAGWALEVVRMVRETGLWLVAVVTAGAMVGSLWFSESAGYVPCTLCWYQRIAMFSLAVLSCVAAVRHDRNFAVYAIVGASVGLVVSTYHYLIEWFPRLDRGACSVDVPCNTVWFREFGFVTLAFMAGCAFIATIVFSAVVRGGNREQGGPDGRSIATS